jgi:transposase
MVAARVLSPRSKLATTRWWNATTLPKQLGVEDASEDDLYAAMDWLLKKQKVIEKKLAARHLQKGGLVLYDLSSSYFEGRNCSLAALGHSRDRKKGTLQVNYGLVTDALGCPVSVSVFPGNTSDSTTLLGEVEKVRTRFGIDSLAIVGDRGMITEKQINELAKQEDVAWITALKTGALRDLQKRGALQLGLFDKRNLFEFSDPDRPSERFVACRNEALAERRARKRQSLIEATVAKLEHVQRMAETGRLKDSAEIGVRVGKIINVHKVGKHFDLEITDDALSFEVNKERVEQEALLDGVYVIRTNVPKESLPAKDAVLAYKRLTSVERAFRSLKTVDLHVRPIRHWAEGRVRAHIFLCMLAYYVQYHMQEAWRELLFFDEELWTRERVDPVAPAKRSASAELKARQKVTDKGHPVHSFRTLLDELGGIVCNRCRRKGASKDEAVVDIETKPTALQKTALDLLSHIAV